MPTPTGMAINAVYTPKSLRGKGYATGAEAGFLQESAAVQVSQLIFRHDGFRNRWFSQ